MRRWKHRILLFPPFYSLTNLYRVTGRGFYFPIAVTVHNSLERALFCGDIVDRPVELQARILLGEDGARNRQRRD
jgi:hypothetical protein